METKFSTPLNELPTFLSTISMVGDDHSAIVQKLREAEHKSPSVYGPTRDLFLAVLEGKLSLDRAIVQAWRIKDHTEKKCATQILGVARDFLRLQRAAHVALLGDMKFILPNGLPLDVSPVWVRQSNPDRLLVLHFWQTAFSPWQLSAAAAVLRSTLFDQKPQYAGCDIDFISIPFSQIANARRFELYNWTKLKPLSESGTKRFWDRFLSAWIEYQRRGPREIRPKRIRTLFD